MKNRCIVTPFFLDHEVPKLSALLRPGWRENKVQLPESSQQIRMSTIHRPLCEFASNAINDGYRPVSIAGDCCTAIGILAGIQRAGINPLLLWFDAHGDFNTWETTPSGFLGGMPLAMIVGRGEQTMPDAVGLEPLPEKQVILTDGRDLDPGERDLVTQSDLFHVTRVKDIIGHPFVNRELYVHFDTDIINPAEAPAMNYRAEGGPAAAELSEVFAWLAGTGNVIAASLSSWNPDYDSDGASREVCMKLFSTLVGKE